MKAKVFEGLLVLVLVGFLWMLPVSEAIDNFRTDVREDNFTVQTAGGQTTADVVLFKPVYNADSQTLSVSSNSSADTPAVASYTAASRLVSVSGLAESESHRLTVSYDVDALASHSSINKLMDYLPWLWVLVLFAFPICVLIAIVRQR